MTKKKVKKKKQTEEKKMFLTTEEFLKVELGQAKIKLNILENEKVQGKINNLLAKFGLDKERDTVHSNIANAKKEYTEVVQAVEARLGIPKFTGYDPDTLEVK